MIQTSFSFFLFCVSTSCVLFSHYFTWLTAILFVLPPSNMKQLPLGQCLSKRFSPSIVCNSLDFQICITMQLTCWNSLPRKLYRYAKLTIMIWKSLTAFYAVANFFCTAISRGWGRKGSTVYWLAVGSTVLTRVESKSFAGEWSLDLRFCSIKVLESMIVTSLSLEVSLKNSCWASARCFRQIHRHSTTAITLCACTEG